MDGGLRFQFEGVEKIQWGEHQRAFIPCAGFVACEVERVPYSECMHKIPDQVEVRPSRQARNDERRAEKAYWMIKKMENRVMKGA